MSLYEKKSIYTVFILHKIQVVYFLESLCFILWLVDELLHIVCIFICFDGMGE